MGAIGSEHLARLQSSFGCDEETAHVIATRGEAKVYPPRSPIILAGDKAQDAWLMLKGHAQAVSYTSAGQFVLVHGFAPGDLFGEAAGLSAGGAESEVAAVGATTAGRFRPSDFVALMENYSCVALTVARQLTRRLAETTRRMVEAATLSTTGRIHAELLRRAKAGEAMTIRPAPVLSELALQVQSTRETVSRTISQLEKRGIIQRDAAALVVVAPHRLEALIF
jgi:CRP/FNR family transcriptional regulator, cyclic AMP receptor protein